MDWKKEAVQVCRRCSMGCLSPEGLEAFVGQLPLEALPAVLGAVLSYDTSRDSWKVDFQGGGSELDYRSVVIMCGERLLERMDGPAIEEALSKHQAMDGACWNALNKVIGALVPHCSEEFWYGLGKEAVQDLLLQAENHDIMDSFRLLPVEALLSTEEDCSEYTHFMRAIEEESDMALAAVEKIPAGFDATRLVGDTFDGNILHFYLSLGEKTSYSVLQRLLDVVPESFVSELNHDGMTPLLFRAIGTGSDDLNVDRVIQLMTQEALIVKAFGFMSLVQVLSPSQLPALLERVPYSELVFFSAGRTPLCARIQKFANVVNLGGIPWELRTDIQPLVDMARMMKPEDLATPTESGTTALHLAARAGITPLVEYLTEHLAPGDLEAVNNDGRNALHFAVEVHANCRTLPSRIELVKSLLLAMPPSSKWQKNAVGRSPYDAVLDTELAPLFSPAAKKAC